MKRVVDLDALIEKLSEIAEKHDSIALGIYKAISTAKEMGFYEMDVIHCKDCEYWQDNNEGYPNEDCKWNKDETPDADDFCSGASPIRGDNNGDTDEHEDR